MIFLAEESMERLFELDWQLLADASLMIVAIFFLFLFMSYFLFNPARKMMADRREKIRKEMEDAKNNLEEANKLRDEYEAKIKNIDKEAEVILSDARKEALDNENEIVARAKEEAGHIIDRAHTEAKLEKQKVADEVKKEMIDIASLMAGKAVKASIDTGIQESLIDETLKEIGDDTWLN